MTKNLHDKGYKRLFSNKLFFRQLIETFVTEEWGKDIILTGSKKWIETIYQTKDEARTMLETTLERYGQDFFVKGKVEGKAEGKAEMLIMLLEERFGNLSREQKEIIYHFNDNRFTQAFKKLLTLKNLTDIFQ